MVVLKYTTLPQTQREIATDEIQEKTKFVKSTDRKNKNCKEQSLSNRKAPVSVH